jgi:two-component system NarL family sensor kinase
LKSFTTFIFFIGIAHLGISQKHCDKLLLEIEAAFEQNEDATLLVRRYEKSCLTNECEELCEYDALKIKFFRTNGDYKAAFDYGKKVLLKSGNNQFRAQILLEIAIVHYLKEDIEFAVSTLHKLILIKERDRETEAKAYLMLGNAHEFLGNTSYALRYFSKTYRSALTLGDSTLISSALNGLGIIAYGKGDRSSMKRAIQLYLKSLKYIETSDVVKSVNVLNNIAAAYLNIDDYKKAEKYFLECSSIYTLMGDFEGTAFSYNNLAAIFIETNQWNKAKEFLDKALALYSDELLGSMIFPQLNLSLSEYYYHLGKYQESRDYYAKYVQQELKRLNAEQGEAVIESQERYDDLRRTKLINDLKLSKKRAEVRNLRLQNAIYIILVAFISISIGAYFLINARRKKEKRERKAALNRAALQSAENEKLRVSRELHDSMGGTLTVMNLLLGHEADKDPSNANLALLSETTKSAIDDLRRICRDLYPSELKISGLSASLRSYFEKLNNSQDGVRFVLEAPEELILDAGFSINFYRIAQELTNNTLKYAKASDAHLIISVADGKFNAFYHDNGQGVDPKQLRKGVGMNSIEERTFSFKGRLEFKSAINKGFSAKMIFFSENIAAMEEDTF